MKVASPQLGVSTQLGQGTAWPLRAPAHPMAILLFGKRPARLVDKRRYPRLAKALRKLEQITSEVAELVGRTGEDFPVELCEGDNASISAQGQIAFGLELLDQHHADHDLLVAILGHEVGHRPWTWPQFDLSRLTMAERDRLYREEEAKADRFAGGALADLGANPGSVIRFLLARAAFEERPPRDYYPADVRAAMIRESYERRLGALRAGQAVLGDLLPRGRVLR